MIVQKFGGTSVGNAKRMGQVLDIVRSYPGQKLVVLSAMAGTTNTLVKIAKFLRAGQEQLANATIDQLYESYRPTVDVLLGSSSFHQRGMEELNRFMEELRTYTKKSFSSAVEKEILSLGELISTKLFFILCQSISVKAALLPALEFMRIDAHGEPDLSKTTRLVKPFIDANNSKDILITQGYICRNVIGAIDNLRRGGSDYTATIIGAVVGAEEIQIWTDIDGVHNNDPRIVRDTSPIRQLSYREAAELAYFGAKILHPTCVLPAEKSNVPLRLKYTMKPDSDGTLISSNPSDRPITAIAAKDGITAIKIYSHRMLLAYGFLRKVFQIFEDHRTSIDMITTSEVALSLTIDQTTHLDSILNKLSAFAEVDCKDGFSIICIVGNALYDNPTHIHRIFSCLGNIPVRMVSMGGSRYNVSLLIASDDKERALKSLHHIFETA